MRFPGVSVYLHLSAFFARDPCRDPYGIGQVVFGLATVIIGISLIRFFTRSKVSQSLRKVRGLRFLATPQGTTAVLLGSILYKFCIQIAINAGLPANMLKFITAALFLLVLVIAGRKGEEIIHA